MSKKCSDKAPLSNKEWSVSKCYKRGFGVGYKIAVDNNKNVVDNLTKSLHKLEKENKGLMEELTKMEELNRRNQQAVYPRLETLNLRDMARYAREFKVKKYGSMTKDVLIRELRAKGYPS